MPAIRDHLRAEVDCAAWLGPGPCWFDEAELLPVRRGGEGEVWGRGVLLHARPLWRTQEPPTRHRTVRILLRVDVHSPAGGHTPRRELEAVHAEAFAMLEGFRPELVRASLSLPLWRYGAPSEPEYHPESGFWFSSAEYRVILAPVT